MKKRTLLSLLLAAVMMIGLLGGCGSGESAVSTASSGNESAEEASDGQTVSAAPEQSNAETEATEADSTQETEPTEEAATSSIVYPLTETAESLSAFGALPNLYSGLDINDFAVYQIAARETGVELDWSTVDQDASSDQFALLIAGGDWPDVAVGGIRYYTSGSEAAVEDDVFFDLSPYLEEYAPDYLNLLESDPYYMKLAKTASGYIPAFCRIGYINSSASGCIVRQDWLDALNLDAPTTYSELTTVLEAFKSNYDCDWPIMKGSAMFFDISGTLMGGYGLTMDFTVRDGQVGYSPALDEWKDYLSMLNTWYSERLFSSDYTTIIGTSFTSQLYSGEVGFWVGGYDFLSDSTAKLVDDPNFKAAALADMTVNSGDTIHTGSAKENMTPTSSWSIFTTSDNLELAMQYCNWFYGPGKTYTDVGEEGVAWEYNDAGDITYTDLIMNNPDGYTVEVAKGLYGGGFLNPGYGSWNSTSAGFSNEQEEACFDVWNSNRDDANLYKTMMTADENASYSAKYNDLKTYVDQVSNQVIVGEMTIDDWDSVVEAMYNDFGLQELLDICQTAYDRYMES